MSTSCAPLSLTPFSKLTQSSLGDIWFTCQQKYKISRQFSALRQSRTFCQLHARCTKKHVDSFIHSNSRYVDSVTHAFDILPPSIYGFQTKIKQCISSNDTGPFSPRCKCAVRMAKKSCPESSQKFALASLLGQSGVFSMCFVTFCLQVSGRSSSLKSSGLWF